MNLITKKATAVKKRHHAGKLVNIYDIIYDYGDKKTK